MRLEILVGNDEPFVYPLRNSKVTIGSADSADVVINADGVSRKHVIVLSEGDAYYVVDQGSTNGTYINEERLVPGRKVDFTSFFPVRLGDNVLISLISEDEDSEPVKIEIPVKEKAQSSVGESTTVISLRELNQAGKTEKLVKNLNEKRKLKATNRPAPAPKTKKKTNLIPFVSALILAAGAYYNYVFLKQSESQAPEVKLETPSAKPDLIQPSASEVQPLIPENELIPAEKLMESFQDLKCVTDLEQYVCQTLGVSAPWGVTQVGLSLYLMLDSSHPKAEALNIIKRADDPVLWKEVAAAYALAELLQRGLSEEKLKGLKLFLTLYDTAEDGSKSVFVVLAIYPEEMMKLKGFLEFSSLFSAEKGGMSAVLPFKKFYRTYPL